jgi:hypothetical protein
VRKLLKGDKPVRVGVVGGSVTFLENDVKAIGWWAKLARFLTTAFPKTTVVAKNGAVPGTPSAYALMCLELMVDPDVDIVFIGGWVGGWGGAAGLGWAGLTAWRGLGPSGAAHRPRA